MASPTFATPLPQSRRSEVLEWRFPKPYRYTLTGKSRAAWHTSFVIPELNLLLDAGLCVNKQRPKHIFLTHGHSDHTLLTPAFIKREDPPDIFCPVEMEDALNAFLRAKTILNWGGLIKEEVIESSGDESDGESGPGDGSRKEGDQGTPPPGRRRGPTHVTHGVCAGDIVPLRRTKDISAMAFTCDHTVPSLGYVFSTTKQKLKPEYASLAGKELKRLREDGVEITTTVSFPMFAFLGDTTAATLASEPEWLRSGIPVVITECSFLYEKHRAQADKTKHTIWADLEPVVRKWPRTTFVIMHFSLRYSDDEVRRHFAEMEDPPANIVIWVDGYPE